LRRHSDGLEKYPFLHPDSQDGWVQPAAMEKPVLRVEQAYHVSRVLKV
jgi:hypothetical protein